ncbi:MAG: hypothetical protein ACE15C_08785 [Phycisphaerae bacterium]
MAQVSQAGIISAAPVRRMGKMPVLRWRTIFRFASRCGNLTTQVVFKNLELLPGRRTRPAATQEPSS